MGLLDAVELDEIFAAENLTQPEFRGRCFESQNISSDAPETEAHPVVRTAVTI
jgi:hypothetical protein